jgi:hypothetical protein
MDLFPARAYPTSGAPLAVRLGDTDGDGDLDAVVADSATNSVGIMRNRGDGTFLGVQKLPTGTTPVSVALGDLDNDGDLDIVSANSGANTITVILGNGDGTYAQGVDHAVGTSPSSVTLGDIDGDGDLDIGIANRQDATVTIATSDGTGTQWQLDVYPLPAPGSNTVLFADVDNDGDADMLVSGYDLQLFLNDSTGSFGGGSFIPVSSGGAVRIAAADVDGDGFTDLGVTTEFNRLLILLRGNGDGTFGTMLEATLPATPTSIEFRDVDDNGAADVVITAYDESTPVMILSNAGGGVFGPIERIVAAARPWGVDAGDLDGDGDTDVVLTDMANQVVDNRTQGGIVVVRNGGVRGLEHAIDVAPPPGQPVAATSTDILAVDIDGDGDADVVTTVGLTGTIVIHRNHDGTFGDAEPIAIDRRAACVRAADLDGDGDLDLVIANSAEAPGYQPSYGFDGVSALFNAGDGTFGPPIHYEVGASPQAVALADIDGDGDVDACVVTRGNNLASIPSGLYVLFNDGTGTFSVMEEYAVAGSLTDVVLGDLDSDGAIDVACSDQEVNAVLIRWGDGAGGFGTESVQGTSGSPAALALHDVNGDDRPDLITANGLDNSFAVLLNAGNRAFEDAALAAAGRQALDLAIRDYDGDGHPDIAVAAFGHQGVAVSLNNGDGTFGARRFSSAPIQSIFLAGSDLDIAAADLDGDGDDELLTTRSGGGFLVLTNQRPRAPSTRCPADVDGDAFVDAADFVVLATHFGTRVPAGTQGDIDGDGRVDVADFAILGANLGRACP